MADISKQPQEPDRPAPEPGGATPPRGGRIAYRRDWKRLGRLLPPVLASWAALVAGGYYVAMQPPDPGLPGPLAAIISPLEPNPFRGCAADTRLIPQNTIVPLWPADPATDSPGGPGAPELPNESAPPIEQQAPNAPAKASGLFVRSAQAQEAAPAEPAFPGQFPIDELEIPNKAAPDFFGNEQQQVQEPPEQQQQQQQQFEPQQQQQQQQQQQFEPQQQQQQQQSVQSGAGSGSFAALLNIPSAVDCDSLGFGDLVDVAMDRSGQSAWTINRYGLVYRSTDGGKTWSQQYLPDLPEGALLSAIAVDDAGRRLVAAARVDGALLQFYRSEDGGDNWRQAPEMDFGVRAPAAGTAVLNEVTGLAIGEIDAANGGTDDVYVLALIIGLGPEAMPSVWRDGSKSWSTGYDQVEWQMIHGLRSHDYGTGIVDVSASGLSTPPIGSWERWQDAQEVRFSQLSRDETNPDGALTDALTPIIAYEIGAGRLRAMAASDDGMELFGADDSAILHGNARDESWSRIDLAPVAGGADFTLGAIDVANAEQAIMAVGRNALFVSQDGGATFFQPVLARWPAPWFYALLLSGPLYAFLLMRPGPPEQEIVNADETKGLSDRALSLKDPDALNLRAHAEGLADLLRNAETKPPLVIGVTGPWGSGKSSVMQMLSELLAQKQMQTVWFNAWHHQSEEHLLASLLSNIRRQGIPGLWTRPGLRLRWRLMLQKLTPHEPIGDFLWWWFLLLLGLALLSGALALWIAATFNAAPPPVAAGESEDFAGFLKEQFCETDACRDLIQAVANVLPSLKIGAFLTLLLGLVPLNRLKQVALITRNFDPAKLMTSVMPARRNPKLDDQLSFRHGFGEELRATIAALAPYRLVIFIDDLDRCRPENVAAVLEAVNFVVSAADCYVVLGMDRAYVLRAIRQEFEKFIEMEKAERQDATLGSPEEDKGRPQDFADHYLEKLVNLIVSVPKMTAEARSRLMESLASAPPVLEDAAPAFDWWRWGRRAAAVAAILAALLGPALYVAALAPPPNLPVATAPATAPTPVAGATPDESVTPGGEVRFVTPRVAGTEAVKLDQGAAQGGIGPMLLVFCGIAAAAGIVWAAARGISVPANLLVRDSGAFKSTLRLVERRLAGFLTTPRRAKRFVNRLRLFGAMTRSGRPLSPAEETRLDRATVQAGALHALARELWVAKKPDSIPPVRAVKLQAEDQRGVAQWEYQSEINELYASIETPERPLIDALYWEFWELSDGATLGDAAVANLAGADVLRPPAADALERLLASRLAA